MLSPYILIIFGFLCVDSAPVSTTAASNKFSCVGKKDGFYSNPNSCDSYYICILQLDREVKCAAGLRYNAKSKFCDYPKTANCQLNPQTGQSSTKQPGTATKLLTFLPPGTNVPTTPASKTGIMLVFGNQTPSTKAQTKVLYFTRSPTNLPAQTNSQTTPTVTNSQTQLLVFNRPVTTKGPINTNSPTQLLVFNKPLATKVPTLTNAPSGSKSTTATYIGGFCYGKLDGLHRDPSDCGSFYQCSYGFTYRSACDKGLVFNDKIDACDYPFSVPACFSYQG